MARQRRQQPPRTTSTVSTATKADEESRRSTPVSALLSGILAFILSVLTVAVFGYATGMFSTATWVPPGLDVATLQARNASGAPFVLAFYSTSCIACRRMRAPFQKAAKALNVPCFAVDVSGGRAERSDDVNAWLALYAVRTIPSVYYVKAARRVKYNGPPSASKIQKFVGEELD